MKTPVKLILWWDLIEDKQQEFFEFNQREFIPTIREMGIEPVEAWYTAYGNWPQFQVAVVSESAERMNTALTSPEWKALENRMLEYVENLESKVVTARNAFQI